VRCPITMVRGRVVTIIDIKAASRRPRRDSSRLRM